MDNEDVLIAPYLPGTLSPSASGEGGDRPSASPAGGLATLAASDAFAYAAALHDLVTFPVPPASNAAGGYVTSDGMVLYAPGWGFQRVMALAQYAAERAATASAQARGSAAAAAFADAAAATQLAADTHAQFAQPDWPAAAVIDPHRAAILMCHAEQCMLPAAAAAQRVAVMRGLSAEYTRVAASATGGSAGHGGGGLAAYARAQAHYWVARVCATGGSGSGAQAGLHALEACLTAAEQVPMLQRPLGDACRRLQLVLKEQHAQATRQALRRGVSAANAGADGRLTHVEPVHLMPSLAVAVEALSDRLQATGEAYWIQHPPPPGASAPPATHVAVTRPLLKQLLGGLTLTAAPAGPAAQEQLEAVVLRAVLVERARRLRRGLDARDAPVIKEQLQASEQLLREKYLL